MDTCESIVDSKGGTAYNESRKRRHSSRVDEAAAKKKKKSMADKSDLLESAIQMLSKKHGLSKQVIKAALIADQQEKLPSINDPPAIEAFFSRNKRPSSYKVVDNRQTAADVSPAPPPAALPAPTPKDNRKNRTGHIPEDHPMRPFVDLSDKDISVKEALARGFRNYRVRLPKGKGEGDDEMGEMHQAGSTANLATLLAETLGTPQNKRSIREEEYVESAELLFSSAFAAPKKGRPKKLGNGNSKKAENMSRTYQQEPLDDFDELSNGDLDDLSDSDFDTSGMLQYTYRLPPFWKLPLVVSKGYKGGFYVMGVKFVQMTTLIANNSFIVPVDEPMNLSLDDQIISLTLAQLFELNGIIIRDASRVEDLNAVFNTCTFLVHHAIADYLLNTFSPLMYKTNAKVNREHAPIKISAEIPPFCCYRQQYFNTALGTMQGDNEIVDASHFTKPLDFTGAPSSNPNFLFDSQTTDRQLSAKEQLHVVTHFDAGTEVEDIAEKFGISASDVELIVADRERVQSSAALVLMEEAREEMRARTGFNLSAISMESSPPPDPRNSKEMTKRKNKVRRTNFAGLNIMMWRYFKGCSDSGVPLNGKMLKEQAMLLAKQMGLENFKGSEGWLDAFKRRHKIDLKQMSGCPAIYEEEGDDSNRNDDGKMDADDCGDGSGSALGYGEVYSNMEDSVSNQDDYSLSHLAVSNNGITAALLECVEMAANPQSPSPSMDAAQAAASVSIGNTTPLDLTHLFSANQLTGDNGLIPSTSNGCIPSADYMMMNGIGREPTPSASSGQLNEGGLIASIVKSVAIRVPDKEVSFALDTIRSFVMSHDPSAMPILLDLQLRLASMRSASSVSTDGGPSPSPSSQSADDGAEETN